MIRNTISVERATSRLHRILAAAILLVVSACSTTPISPESKASLKGAEIGTVSLLGTEFSSVYNGVTIFGNEASAAQVPEWRIDALSTEVLIKELQGKGYTSKALRLDAATTESFYVDDGNRRKLSSRLDLAKLSSVAAEQQFKVIAIVYRRAGNTEDPIENSVPGSFGIFRKNLFGVKIGCVYSMIRVALIDVATNKEIAGSDGAPCSGGYDAMPEWKDSFENYSAAEKEGLREFLTTRLTKQLQQAASDIKL